MPRSKRIFKKRINVGVPKSDNKADCDTDSDTNDVAVAGTSTAVSTSAVDSTSAKQPSQSTSASVNPDQPCSASKQKLTDQLPLYNQFVSDEAAPFSYSIVNLNSINELLNKVCCCKICHQPINIFARHINGLAENIHIKCESCTNNDQFMCNSDKLDFELDGESQSFYDINTRLVYGMRSIGKGQYEAQTFCGIMNLPPPTTQYQKTCKLLASAAEQVCSESMREAVEEAVSLNDDNRDIDAAFDGSWQKRGHNSMNGVITSTSVHTGRVIDCEILSKFCKCENRLKDVHDDNCAANYIGTSGGMEVEGVSRIFDRSLAQHNIRYKTYLGDGDSRAFKAVCEKQPYGPNFVINKLECIGHVQKRMGTRLRSLKKKLGSEKLSDGKTIGGKGRLTDAVINKIQQYYGQAIRAHTDNVEDMKRAVWAIYFHLWSSNERPLHGLCPKGPESWCKYQKAVTSNEDYNHDQHEHYPDAIIHEIKPIFKDLADPELLKKCLHNSTQNANESVNSVIWTRLPKTAFVQLNTLKFGVYEAIASFNKGNIT
ncbi:MAG: hypothetical protein H9Q66_05815, partial [Spiroplasma ixodetis]|nr:hypothetical protein [Spiroplasma ixodetis]